MFKRGYVVAASGALALLLTAVQTCPAQFVTFPIGRGGVAGFAPRGFGYYPGAFGSPYYGSPYYGSPYNTPYVGYNPSFYRPGYSSYSISAVTPLYYGAASSVPGSTSAYTPARLVSPPLDSLTSTAAGAASAALATPNYPLQSPDYNVIYPVSPPLSQLTDNTAKVEVHVAADARLWFDGQATNQTGADRSFTTPTLEPRQDYVYEVRARWEVNGKPVDQTRKVTVRAGDRVVVDFHRAVAAK